MRKTHVHRIPPIVAAFFVALATVSFSGGALAQPSSPNGDIGFERAREIALRHVPGAHVESIERDFEAGQLVYEVELRTPQGVEHELWIDARDGRVLRDEIED